MNHNFHIKVRPCHFKDSLYFDFGMIILEETDNYESQFIGEKGDFKKWSNLAYAHMSYKRVYMTLCFKFAHRQIYRVNVKNVGHSCYNCIVLIASIFPSLGQSNFILTLACSPNWNWHIFYSICSLATAVVWELVMNSSPARHTYLFPGRFQAFGGGRASSALSLRCENLSLVVVDAMPN